MNLTDSKSGKPLKAHHALKVITLDSAISEWLKQNDPKALEQAEAAVLSSEDPAELLRDAIFAQHEDAHGMHNGTVEDRRWGFEILLANVLDAIEQAGFTPNDVFPGAKAVREQRKAEGYIAPTWNVTPAEKES